MIKKSCLSLILVLSIAGCQSTPINSPRNEIVVNSSVSSEIVINSKNTISGTIQFPKLGFKVKADEGDISDGATVSIIYLPNDETNANKVIASGLADVSNKFVINYSESFSPQVNDIFVLEASKRIGGAGNNLMTLRTFIKWNGTSWDSITNSGIYINTYTTALTIIANSSVDGVLADDVINKLTVSGDTITPVDIGVEPNIIPAQTVTDVSNLVISALQESKDPFSSIFYNGYLYYIDRSYEIGKLKETGICISCSLVGQRLPDILSGADLTNSNLSEQYLVNINLSNTQLSGVNISNSILTNKDLRTIAGKNLSSATIVNTLMDGVNLSGTLSNPGINLSNSDLTDSDLSYSDLKYTNLTNVQFNNTDLSYVDLTGATITQTTDFSGADMSNAIWTDGTIFNNDKICGENSLGQCK